MQRVSDLYEAMSLEVAESIARQLKEKPDSVIALPTGRSPIGCYRILSEWSEEGMLDWSRVNCFQLDEYIDVDPPYSFGTFLSAQLYDHTNLPPENRHSPVDTDDYDSLIERYGGLDLIVLGLGTNGHIAFNEPGTPRQSWTHSLWLTESTRSANAPYFESKEKVPTRAVTMGIKTILGARRIILMASGERKKIVLRRALLDGLNVEIPGSHLALHPRLKVVADFDMQGGGDGNSMN